jgi:hypothetical protein
MGQSRSGLKSGDQLPTSKSGPPTVEAIQTASETRAAFWFDDSLAKAGDSRRKEAILGSSLPKRVGGAENGRKTAKEGGRNPTVGTR